MSQPFYTVESFFPDAAHLRVSIDELFSNPHIRHGDAHQIWDYWYVPQLYTYLRADPKNVFPAGLFQQLMTHLTQWANDALGFTTVSYPYLSLYVDGCGQGLHNDAKNGHWAYVYSLTNWHTRKFVGGETLLFHEEAYWHSEKIKERGAGNSFYTAVPSSFNQLVVFDDRMIHGVQPLQGQMDPLEGRFVLHGHIRSNGFLLQGDLPWAEVDALYQAFTERAMAMVQQMGGKFHGFMSIRLWVDPEGTVAHQALLTNRVLKTSAYAEEPALLAEELLAITHKLRFPASEQGGVVTFPVLVDFAFT